MSYLGTWAANRQAALERFFLEPARRLPRRRFVIGGAQYPADFAWTDNLWFVRHLPPPEHPAFYCSSAGGPGHLLPSTARELVELLDPRVSATEAPRT